MAKRNIRDLELQGKKVLMRVDFNVPMKNGEITDKNRIIQALPTINYALDHGAKVILFSHLGRVKTEEDLKKNSLEPVARELAIQLGKTDIIPTSTVRRTWRASEMRVAEYYPTSSGYQYNKQLS